MKNDKAIKCIVWDLDNTIWDGVLLESDNIVLKPGIKAIIETLDSRGVLHSISSKNDHVAAMAKLSEFGLSQYFLYPQIHWNIKSLSLKNIHEDLNIAMDAMLFVDDQEFELDEVATAHPTLNCMNANKYHNLLNYPQLNPRFITVDSARRRKMYQADQKRKQAEQDCLMPHNEFLASLRMKLTIQLAEEEDLRRAEELTIRTNQLNATGRTFDYDELNKYRQSPEHELLLCELEDKYGSYGKIGLALINLKEEHWKIEMMLMSCRVMSRGVGTLLLTYILHEAKMNNKLLLADFVDTGRNRMMNISYRFAGFTEKMSDGNGRFLLQNDCMQVAEFPSHVVLIDKCKLGQVRVIPELIDCA